MALYTLLAMCLLCSAAAHYCRRNYIPFHSGPVRSRRSRPSLLSYEALFQEIET
jgi:hypothetical protein